MKSFVRISALLWADILVAYALFVMQKYLTDVWELSFTHAAGILNIWGGISMVLQVFFLFLVDALLGNFTMLVVSSIAYAVGIGLVSMSIPPVLGSCSQYKAECIGDTQKVLFYIGMAFLAVGIPGHNVSVKPFLEEQDDKPENQKTFTSVILGFTLVVLVPVIGAIALPYIKPWTLRFGIPAICILFATVFFFTGCCKYDKKKRKGSPITTVCRVFVAFFLKRSQLFPDDDDKFYKKADEGKYSFSRTRFLRCLERAAIILPGEEEKQNKWRLCSVAEVESAKIALRMVPMWITFIICGIVSSIGNTYFIEQANHMNRKIGKWRLPLPVLLLLFGWAKKIFALFAAQLLKKPKTQAPSIGIGVAMIFSVLCCITAAKFEIRRLGVIRRHGLLDKPDEVIPMSMFWLVFQFSLLAGLDTFFEKSVKKFYDYQSPESMREYLDHFTTGVSGLGFMCSVLSVHVVGVISEKGGRTNWFQHTLNRSRLDKYYWVLAGLSSVNLVVFVLVALCYSYKKQEVLDNEVAGRGGGGGGALASSYGTEDDQFCSCFGKS